MLINIEEVLSGLAKDLDLDNRDLDLMLRRYDEEGISFLTKTLPAFSKAILHGLSTGFLPLSRMTAFEKIHGLPVFLRKYTKQVFTKSGALKEAPDPISILVIRQLCDYFYKLSFDFSPELLADAEKAFVATDDSLPVHIETVHFAGLRKWILNNFKSLNVTANYVLQHKRTRFGPGTFSTTGLRLDDGHIPYYRTKLSSVAATVAVKHRAVSGFFKAYPASKEKLSLDTMSTELSELLFVPKDSRGPRTIVREPFHNIRLQMCFHDFTREALEKDTNCRINFLDQDKNQELARVGSIAATYSTLDLKDASDRVSYPLVKYLFGSFPMVSWFLDKARTKSVKLPSGGTKQLNKLAGMGSGFTFPMMAALIYSTICHSVQANTGTDIRKHVYVYGDDIIVPTRYVDLAKQALASVYLNCNEDKSFSNVRPAKNRKNISTAVFRESCGGDFFGGNNVTPIRLKFATAGPVAHPGFISFAKKDEAILQLERHCRELVADGHVNLAEYYYLAIEDKLGKLPIVCKRSPALGRLGSYEEKVDNLGNFIDVEVFLPFPSEERSPEMSPQRYIADSLLPRRRFFEKSEMTDYYQSSTAKVAFGRITIPRKITLKKVVRSNFLLG